MKWKNMYKAICTWSISFDLTAPYDITLTAIDQTAFYCTLTHLLYNDDNPVIAND